MQNRKDNSMSLNVLVAAVGGTWIAQAVEFNLFAQAKSLDDLKVEFCRVVDLHIKDANRRGVEPFTSLVPTPASVKALFDSQADDISFEPRNAPPRAARLPSRIKRARIYSGSSFAGVCPAV